METKDNRKRLREDGKKGLRKKDTDVSQHAGKRSEELVAIRGAGAPPESHGASGVLPVTPL